MNYIILVSDTPGPSVGLMMQVDKQYIHFQVWRVYVQMQYLPSIVVWAKDSHCSYLRCGTTVGFRATLQINSQCGETVMLLSICAEQQTGASSLCQFMSEQGQKHHH